jgi:serine phosphatase RsbU (regulator of sigma subunit)
MPSLTFRNGARQGTTQEFDAAIVVGRGRAVAVMLDDASVSRRHASIEGEAGVWRISDLGSANGTLLNGRPVSAPTVLADGDTITFGGIVAVFHAAGLTPPPAPVSNVHAIDLPEGEVVLSLPAVPAAFDEDDAGQVRRSLQARLAFLDSLSRSGDLIFDETRLLAFVLDHLLQLLPQGDRTCAVAFDPSTGTVVPLASQIRGSRERTIAVSRTLLREVVSRREAVLIGEASTGADRWRTTESFVLHRMRSVICAPMILGDEIYGVLQVDNGKSPVAFEKSDLDLLRSVAYQVAMLLAYTRLHRSAVEQRLIEHDLQLARKVQQNFLPEQPPTIPGYGFTVDYIPSLGVSGDFYDFLPFSPERIGIVIGDVSGKGVSAALFGARISSDLRFVAAGQSEPGAILSQLNSRFAAAAPEGMFVTMVLAVLDTTTGRIAVANAGHPAPLLRHAGGRLEPLGRTGQPPIGVTDGITYLQEDRSLSPGDVVAFYTDGISEAMTADRVLFGEEGLGRVMSATSGGAAAVRQTSMAAVHEHVAGQGFSDDVTLLCVSRE